jgi:NarL family two-component system response regulator LiaR
VSDENKIRVLLVDDSQVFLRAATAYLQRQPELEIVSALTSAVDVLEQIEELQPQVVLADLNMPGMTGLELITRLKELTPNVRLIALTLLSAARHRQAALAAGADDYVSKGDLISHLLPAIHRAVRKGDVSLGQENRPTTVEEE